jgi:FKBP-type peptidyl-prolyl cis-trans isomerase
MRTLVLIAALLALAGCKKPSSTPLTTPAAPTVLPDGLSYQLLATGSGDEARSGDKISVHYIGRLENGTVFDSSRDRGEPFTFRLGKGLVITGWDEGLVGMREGEQRRLIIPPALGYGSSDKGKIPANSTLTFDVEMVDVW